MANLKYQASRVIRIIITIAMVSAAQWRQLLRKEKFIRGVSCRKSKTDARHGEL